MQEGNIGLLEAVKNFDPYRGVRFPSYAIWWIRAYIIRYVMNNWRLVKLGTTQAQRKLFFNLQREKDRLEREGFRPDPDLIAERLSVKRSEVVEMEQRLSGRDLSVDAPMGEDGDASMLDFLSKSNDDTEARVGEAEVRALITEKIHEFGETLRDKEKVIFNLRMVAEEPLTLQEIGEKYGISRERVRQIEERIKKRLRSYLVEQIPDISDVDVRLTLAVVETRAYPSASRYSPTPRPVRGAPTRHAMLPCGWRFSYIAWCTLGMSLNSPVCDRHGSTFFASTSSLSAVACSSFAKCEPWKRFWRIHR